MGLFGESIPGRGAKLGQRPLSRSVPQGYERSKETNMYSRSGDGEQWQGDTGARCPKAF